MLSEEFIRAPLRIMWNDWRGRFGIVILFLYIMMGTIGVWLIDTPTAFAGEPRTGPFQSINHILGTTNIGQDLFALIVHSTPAMLIMIAAGGMFTAILGTVVGTIAGYKGGNLDQVLMTVSDIVMTVPGLPLVAVLAVTIEPENPAIVGIILAVNGWALLARVVRSQVLTIREKSFVEASRAMGIPGWKIILRDILPGLMPFITINAVSAGRKIIFNAVGLYFLGLLPYTSLNWGVIMNNAYTNDAMTNLDMAYWIIIPSLTVILLSYALIMLAQSTDYVFNPKVRTKHMKTGETTTATEEL